MIDAGQQAGHRRGGPPDGVPPDEGVEGGLHKPLPDAGQEVDAVHRLVPGGHQVLAVARQDAHQHHADGHSLLPQDRAQPLEPEAGVHQVIHQDYRAVE